MSYCLYDCAICRINAEKRPYVIELAKDFLNFLGKKPNCINATSFLHNIWHLGIYAMVNNG
jgi:hypothetical protein